MPWTAILAVVAMLFVQAAFAAACLYAYTRIRTQQDQTGRDASTWAARIELAVTNADSAKRQVESIEVEKYNRLRTRIDELESELVKYKTALRICETKLASEERMGRKAAAKAAKADDDDDEEVAQPGGLDAATLARLGAMKLTAPPAAPAAQTTAPNNFGRTVR